MLTLQVDYCVGGTYDLSLHGGATNVVDVVDLVGKLLALGVDKVEVDATGVGYAVYERLQNRYGDQVAVARYRRMK